MLLISLLLIPTIGILLIASLSYEKMSNINLRYYKVIALVVLILNLFISLIIFIYFNFSNNQF